MKNERRVSIYIKPIVGNRRQPIVGDPDCGLSMDLNSRQKNTKYVGRPLLDIKHSVCKIAECPFNDGGACKLNAEQNITARNKLRESDYDADLDLGEN